MLGAVVRRRASRSVLLFLVASSLAACSGDDGSQGSSRHERCERLLDHEIDLRLAIESNIDVDAHRKVMREALGKDFVASCATKMTDAEVDCALAAADSKAVSACSQPSSSH
jgi:hypothetical protein